MRLYGFTLMVGLCLFKNIGIPIEGEYMRYDDLSRKVGKTYSSASEAFRDADYATPIWRCETDFDRTKQYLGGIAVFAVLVGFLFILGSIPFNVIAKVVA